jgi:DNA replication protein DnaC
LDEFLSDRFVTEKQNLILYGPMGTGETRLVIALGVKPA